MKKNIFIAIIGISLLFFSNCNWIDPDINVDPNNPADVPLNLLLPSTQVSLAYMIGGDFGRYSTIWTQQHGGAERQHAGYDSYQLKETDTNNAWSTIYTDVFNDSKIIMKKAKEVGSSYYQGIAQTMTAMTLAMMVDLFNDIPYSESFDVKNFKPKYDTGADVYTNAQELLTQAIANFETNDDGPIQPGSDDFVYGGDVQKWKALAYSLKARLYLHLSEIDGAAYGNVLGVIDNALIDNEQNAMVGFGADATSQNPWFQFEDQRGDVVMGSKLMDLMNNTDDPRLSGYATMTDDLTYAGMVAGEPDNSGAVSRFGSFYASKASPVPFMTYMEVKFMEAEAALPTDAARAATAYNEAILASLEFILGEDGDYADWVVANAAEDATTITLEKILTQKYIALYTQIEVFNDWRRKGIPVLTPATGTTKIATRFPYPRNERLYNTANMPEGLSVFDKVFWDQ